MKQHPLLTAMRRNNVLVFIAALMCLTACDRTDGDNTEAMDPDTAAAMSKEHAGDRPIASGAAKTGAAKAVESEVLPYAEVGGQLARGYFAFPADMLEPLPAVLMIHEWWGLNDNIRAMADRVAGEGYMVLAVDLYDGGVAESPAQAQTMMASLLNNQDAAKENLRQAYAFLTESAGAPRVASIGWCLGGFWSLNTALLFPNDLDAAVIYYGQVTSDESKLEPLQMPVLGIFGGKDTAVKVKTARDFEKALKNLGKEHQIKVYPKAAHAFANPSGTNYDRKAAEDAWKVTRAFLAEHLRVAEVDDP